MKLNQSSENTLPQTGDSKAKLQDSVGEMKLNQSSENTLPQTGDSKAKLQDSVGEMKLNQSSENTLPQTGDSKAKLQGIVGLVLLFFASLLGLQISRRRVRNGKFVTVLFRRVSDSPFW
ncbi:LPXTG cell wall anchor domain-containing protein [Enterococcus sp. DA9]|uniref:LPXTG cell wall anchor domain-containing protein n=1 Tax=Enterococcus sp. DA9 TaxID=2603296 RepID=UPI0011C88E4C|nr:LPXTG cell wall anchor domain-containing protein [Enterococcus sp. DA9]